MNNANNANNAVAVVIPAYNEAPTIRDVVERARRQLDWVIVVDDGSNDGTGEGLGGLGASVLRHAENRGKAAALHTGIEYALAGNARAIMTLDSDGQHRPEDIPLLLAAAAQHPHRIIVAARLKRRAHVPHARRFANRVADFWLSWACGYRVRDSQSGFRLYPAALFERVSIPHDRKRGFVFESEILIEAARAGFFALPVDIDALYPPTARPSYYQPWVDTARITRMVAWKLLQRGLYPSGLWRSRKTPP